MAQDKKRSKASPFVRAEKRAHQAFEKQKAKFMETLQGSQCENVGVGIDPENQRVVITFKPAAGMAVMTPQDALNFAQVVVNAAEEAQDPNKIQFVSPSGQKLN